MEFARAFLIKTDYFTLLYYDENLSFGFVDRLHESLILCTFSKFYSKKNQPQNQQIKEENNNNNLAPSLGLILIVLYSIFKKDL